MLHRITVGRNLEPWWRYEGGPMLWPLNFPKTRLSGSQLSWPRLAKARSGLVPTFQRWEKKLAVSFGLYNSPRLLDVAQESGLSPSGDVVTPVDVLAIEVANVQAGVWKRRDGCWSESQAWRFVDVDDLVSCDVYAQLLSLWLFWRLIDQWPFQPLLDKRGKAVIPAQDWPI